MTPARGSARDGNQQPDAALRVVNTALRFWWACGEKACKRARACCGNAHACWQRWRQAVPEVVMMQMRTVISARLNGASAQEAAAAGRRVVAEADAAAARPAALDTTDAAPTAALPHRPSAISPRVRLV